MNKQKYYDMEALQKSTNEDYSSRRIYTWFKHCCKVLVSPWDIRHKQIGIKHEELQGIYTEGWDTM